MGRRWITIDTSRVALALARTRLMAAKYPYYLLADSREGRAKEQAITGHIQPDTPTVVASEAQVAEALTRAAADSRGFSEQFLLSEWRSVVDAWQIADAAGARCGRHCG